MRNAREEAIASAEREQWRRMPPDADEAHPGDPTFMVVFNYHDSELRKFWSGRRPVDDPSDAETYTTWRAVRAAFRKASYLRDKNPTIVENYGLTSEREALR